MLAALLMSSLSVLGADKKIIGAQDIVALVKGRSPSALAAAGAVDAARARAQDVQRYPNPGLVWDRESLLDDGADSIVLSLPLDLSSRRNVRGYLASSHVSKAKAHASKVSSDAVVQALGLLFDFVAHQSREVIESDAVERLNEAARVVKRRREEGDTSGYDLSRIEIEAELAMSELRQTRASTERLYSELANFLGLDRASVRFEASLDADLSLSSEEQVFYVDTTHVGHMRDAASRAQEASEASGRTWVPEVVVSGGPRLAHDVESELGYTVGVSLEVPVFSWGQDLRDEALAEGRSVRAQAEATEREARGSVIRAQRVLRAAREEVSMLSEKTHQRIERLERAARSGYREGELTIVELLDGERVCTQLKMHQLRLRRSAKQAEVGLRAARGDYQ